MKPGPVLGTQRLIGPPKEVALFLGTGHKQPIGVDWGMALLKCGWFTTKALQTTLHVQHFGMRLSIHGFHIVKGLVLPTKQQTRLYGTFDIVPSVLRLTGLQTHVMARAHHVVHGTGWSGVLGFSQGFHIVIHVRHGELRRRWRLVHHVIQFFHHFFHSGSGFFHDLSYHRITVLRRHQGFILLLLLLLPDRVRTFGRFSLPTRIGITSWRDRAIVRIRGHPGKVVSPPPHTAFYTLEPFMGFSRDWSPFHDLIRPPRCPIGQLSIFKKVPASLGLHSEWMDYYKDLKRDTLLRTTSIWPNVSNEV